MHVLALVLFLLTGCMYVGGDLTVNVNDPDNIVVRDTDIEGFKLPLP